eukprot:sb/3460957/
MHPFPVAGTDYLRVIFHVEGNKRHGVVQVDLKNTKKGWKTSQTTIYQDARRLIDCTLPPTAMSVASKRSSMMEESPVRSMIKRLREDSGTSIRSVDSMETAKQVDQVKKIALLELQVSKLRDDNESLRIDRDSFRERSMNESLRVDENDKISRDKLISQSAMPVSLLINIIPIGIGFVGEIANCLSIYQQECRRDSGLAAQLYRLLNILDTILSALTIGLFCKTMITDTWPSTVEEILFFTVLRCTCFVNCLLSTTRTISLAWPFYTINRRALWVLSCIAITLIAVTMVTYFVVDSNTRIHFLAFFIVEFSTFMVVVLVTTVGTCILLLKDGITPGSNVKRRASLTIVVISSLFLLFYSFPLSVLVKDGLKGSSMSETSAMPVSLLINIIPIGIGFVGEIANCLSIYQQECRRDSGLAAQLYRLLNILDTILSALTIGLFCKTMITDTWPSTVEEILFFTVLRCTCFVNCLLSTTRTISLAWPFYTINRRALWVLSCIAITLIAVTMVTYFVVDSNTRIHFLAFFIVEFSTFMVVVLVTTVGTCILLLKDGITPGSNVKRRASLTIVVISSLFLLFYSFPLSVLVKDGLKGSSMSETRTKLYDKNKDLAAELEAVSECFRTFHKEASEKRNKLLGEMSELKTELIKVTSELDSERRRSAHDMLTYKQETRNKLTDRDYKINQLQVCSLYNIPYSRFLRKALGRKTPSFQFHRTKLYDKNKDLAAELEAVSECFRTFHKEASEKRNKLLGEMSELKTELIKVTSELDSERRRSAHDMLTYKQETRNELTDRDYKINQLQVCSLYNIPYSRFLRNALGRKTPSFQFHREVISELRESLDSITARVGEFSRLQKSEFDLRMELDSLKDKEVFSSVFPEKIVRSQEVQNENSRLLREIRQLRDAKGNSEVLKMQIESLQGTITALKQQVADNNRFKERHETLTGKQPIRTCYLGHVTGYQPIRDQHFLIRSVPATWTRAFPPRVFLNRGPTVVMKCPSELTFFLLILSDELECWTKVKNDLSITSPKELVSLVTALQKDTLLKTSSVEMYRSDASSLRERLSEQECLLEEMREKSTRQEDLITDIKGKLSDAETRSRKFRCVVETCLARLCLGRRLRKYQDKRFFLLILLKRHLRNLRTVGPRFTGMLRGPTNQVDSQREVISELRESLDSITARVEEFSRLQKSEFDLRMELDSLKDKEVFSSVFPEKIVRSQEVQNENSRLLREIRQLRDAKGNSEVLKMQIESLQGTITALKQQVADNNRFKERHETLTGKQPIRTCYLGQLTGYQPIRDQHFQLHQQHKIELTFLLSILSDELECWTKVKNDLKITSPKELVSLVTALQKDTLLKTSSVEMYKSDASSLRDRLTEQECLLEELREKSTRQEDLITDIRGKLSDAETRSMKFRCVVNICMARL